MNDKYIPKIYKNNKKKKSIIELKKDYIKYCSKNELNIFKKIKEIQNYDKYFIIPIEEVVINEKKMSFFSLKKTIDIKDYLLNNKNVRCVIDIYISLLKSYMLLNENNIYYLNPSGVKMNSNSEPLLCDFTKSAMNNIENNIEFNINLNGVLLESKVLNYLKVSESLSVYNIELISNCYENAYEVRCYLSKFINKPKEYIISNIFKYSKTWDNYLLSRWLLKNYERLLLCDSFINLLKKNSSDIPSNRYSIEETIHNIEYLTLDSEIKKMELNI